MKQLNWYQIFGKSNIPDGRTVLPTDDIQILLHCANIWDKAYTTIAQLLADTTSLMTVISDNNAVDYLVRSTTFASSVTADSSAMTYIGLNNYASNTLLADSTWCNAICNSAYFESVLNATVPIMTSATTPEGEVGASAYFTGEDPYRAFNGNPATAWTVGSPTRTGWIYYRFVSPVSVKKFTMQNRDENTYYICSPKTFALEGSNDGVTYTSLGNFTNTNNTRAYKCAFNVNNSDEYEYYRLNISDVNQTEGGVCIGELQFYGRKDV